MMMSVDEFLEKSLRSSELLQTLEDSTLREMMSQCQRVRLSGGETLMQRGEPGDCLYIVLTGRLRFFVESPYMDDVIVGEVGVGDTVGEMALLTGDPRSATVCAVRDSELLKVTRGQFDSLVERHPAAMMQLARMIVRRQQRVRSLRTPQPPSTILVAPVALQAPFAEFMEKLSRRLSVFGPVARVNTAGFDRQFGQGASQDLTEGPLHREALAWLGEHEATHRFVIFEGDPRPSLWNEQCLRQADLVLLVGDGGREPPYEQVDGCLQWMRDGIVAPRLELVLLHEDGEQMPRGTARWLERWSVHRHHHVRANADRDFDRLARVIVDQGVGVVLGGGGARGLAHIGVMKALLEADAPVDVIGGCSMGSMVAAQYAAGWNCDTILEKNRRLWIQSGNLFDYTVPLVSLIAGRKGRRLISELFADIAIEDLWIDYYCVSSDLTNASLAVHTKGLLWQAVLASVSLPGILPPRIHAGQLHCDGGVLDNLPVDCMRTLTRGPILAVDVGLPKDVSIAPSLETFPTGGALLWRKLNPFAAKPRVPNIFSILYRSSVLASIRRAELVRKSADLCIRPKVEDYKIFDFGSIDALVQCGYEAMSEHIDQWRRIISSRSRPKESSSV